MVAEFAVRIGDNLTPGRGEDGDLTDVFNRRRIRLCHADMICHPRVDGVKVGGQLGIAYPLLEKYYQRQAQYVWERVSRDEVKRTNLWTLDEVVYGSTPIDDPDQPGRLIHCHVELHFEFRLQSVKLPIFGSEDAEIEYGGRSKRDAATVELLWDDIEHDTPLRRVDHDAWPMGMESPPAEITLELLEGQAERLRKQGVPEPFEIKYFDGNRKYSVGHEGDRVTAILGGDMARHYLWITVDDFDDAMAEELKAPLTKKVSVTEENPEGVEIVKKRKYYIDWEADVAASLSNTANVVDVRDRTKRVDIRAEEAFVRASIVQTKSVT